MSPDDGLLVPVDPGVQEPKPISDFLRQHLDDTLSQIPSGKRGQASASVSTDGVEAEIGARWTLKPGIDATASGYAAREWGGSGWTAGARAGLIF